MLIVYIFFSFTEKIKTDFMFIVFDFDKNSTSLAEKMKEGIADYSNESLTNTLTNPNEMDMTLYPDEENYNTEKMWTGI